MGPKPVFWPKSNETSCYSQNRPKPVFSAAIREKHFFRSKCTKTSFFGENHFFREKLTKTIFLSQNRPKAVLWAKNQFFRSKLTKTTLVGQNQFLPKPVWVKNQVFRPRSTKTSFFGPQPVFSAKIDQNMFVRPKTSFLSKLTPSCPPSTPFS